MYFQLGFLNAETVLSGLKTIICQLFLLYLFFDEYPFLAY